MAKYICIVCNHIYDEDVEGVKFEDLPDDYVCPLCGVPKSMFEEIDESEIINDEQEFSEETRKNAIKIAENNVAIERINEICIECGVCINTCKTREGINDICDGKACVNCGQCIQTCPTGALIPKRDKNKLYDALKEGKICIAYTSPSVRVAIGDEFGIEEGAFLQGKLVSALRKIGFKYVLDVTFGADLTIVEEANELVARIKNNGVLPMFTSCCPSWIKYAEQYYPEILPNISTCKSPIGMQSEIVKNYFTMKNGINKNNIFTVAITPCTAKKFEISREEIGGTDCVITTLELSQIIKEKGINFFDLEDSEYDSLLGEGSGAGTIFGNTGGVMEAALRTAYNIITGEELDDKNIEFKSVRGIETLKEAEVKIGDIKLNVAVINKMAAAKELLEEVKNGTSKYHYIEIMNCLGGCIGGGGQPKIPSSKEIEVKEKRIKSLYDRDKVRKVRASHNNPDIKKLYKEYLEKPLSHKAEELLHTKYIKRDL